MQVISSFFTKMLQTLNKHFKQKAISNKLYTLYIHKREIKQERHPQTRAIKQIRNRRNEMAFLTLNIEKNAMMIERTQLEYQQMIFQNYYNDVLEEMTGYLQDGNTDTESAKMKELQTLQQYYDTQKSSVESRLKLLNQEIESFDKVIGENIKNTCKLTYSA